MANKRLTVLEIAVFPNNVFSHAMSGCESQYDTIVRNSNGEIIECLLRRWFRPTYTETKVRLLKNELKVNKLFRKANGVNLLQIGSELDNSFGRKDFDHSVKITYQRCKTLLGLIDVSAKYVFICSLCPFRSFCQKNMPIMTFESYE
ncbi:hypothetical protein OUZ56_020094 [Daphnia magna]|uniref:Uncharacterized protein n=1 Tax=Daphnia magna TaxID=35525 RepID=A0ABQ9ZE90_9CRUS|nr:hypothetical protein OUZ56_020094 [Daphnia magna]